MKRDVQSAHRRLVRWGAVALLIVLPCFGLPLCCLSFPTLLEWGTRKPFDSARWKANESSGERYDMIWGLRYGGLLTGKPRAEVEEMLGKPDTTDVISGPGLPKYNAAGVEPGSEVWYYGLGGEKYAWGIGPSGAVLAVDFKDGKVERVRKIVH